MTLDFHSLYGVYDSTECNVAESFYTPIFSNAILFDRISCYFSSKALSTYSIGIEKFAKKPGSKYRLLVSEYISKKDFDAIVEGVKNRAEIDYKLASRLRETLTLDESNHLSNLTYLISIGVVELKIAYVKAGIFHHKMGYAENEFGDSIFFMGSNNETEAAIRENYESFLAIDGVDEKYRFEEYWEGRKEGVKILEPSEIIWKELNKYNKGHLLDPYSESIPENSIYLDYIEGEMTIDITLDNPPDNYNLVQLSKIGNYVTSYDDGIKFKEAMNYIDCNSIIRGIEKYCVKKNYPLVKSKGLNTFISANNLLISRRRSVGIEIKNKGSVVQGEYNRYKGVVDACMKRKLRDKQMWDSFFMWAMKKAGNFSVPGSGKTASVLGVYAYLRYYGELKRIIVVGPLNSFDSWINEYKECFTDEPSIFDSRYNHGSSSAQIGNLLANYATKNLFLFNYESLEKYEKEIKKYLIEDSLLVFDEAHYVKGINTRRSREARIISEKSTRTIIMTGTPMPNSYTDLYNPLHILFPSEYDSFFSFTLRMLSNPNQSIVEDLNKKIQPFFCRTNKDELGVPPAEKDIDCTSVATYSENKLYDAVLSKYRDNKLALIIRILQLESDPQMLLKSADVSDKLSDYFDDDFDLRNIHINPAMNEMKGEISEIKQTSKTRNCIDLITKLVGEGKTVVVWCIFKKSIENLNSSFLSRGISSNVVYGSTGLHERTRIINEFKERKISVLITNPHTLAESISLHNECHDAVYFEYSYNLVHLLQSKDRIHRLGLEKNQYTQYYFMKANYKSPFDKTVQCSMDDVIYKRLLEKEKNMLDAISSGTLEQGTTSKEDIDYVFNKMGWN